MKKMFFLLIISMFLITFVSAGSCTPNAGYDECVYYKSSNYDGVQAKVRLESTKILPEIRWAGSYTDGQGITHPYAVGGAYWKYNFDYADDTYVYFEDINDVDDNGYCGESGCSNGDSIPEEGKYTIVRPGEEYSGAVSFVGFDYDHNADGAWAWVWGGFGWNSWTYRAVECYDNTDCSSEQICDKSSDWSNWNCRQKDCSPGQNKCEGLNYYTCAADTWKLEGLVLNQCGIECLANSSSCSGNEVLACKNNKWDTKGQIVGKCGVQCVPGDEQCFGKNSAICQDDFTWKDLGPIEGQCSVVCTKDSSCRNVQEGIDYCLNNQVYTNFFVGYCDQDNLCNIKEKRESKLIENCTDICLNGFCSSKIKTTREATTIERLIPASISFVILSLLIILLLVRRKK